MNAIAGNPAEAQGLWQAAQQLNPDQGETAAVLSGLWSEPPQLLPQAEPTLKLNLRGWFKDEALERLYTLEQRQTDLAELALARQARAEQTLSKLAFVILLPIVSALIGSGIILTLLVNTWRSRQRSQPSPLAIARWEVPWDGAWLAIGLLGGFFFVGQIIISMGLGGVVFALVNRALGALASPDSAGMTANLVGSIRAQAIGVFCVYNLMAIGVLSFLYLCLKSFAPLPADWFQLSPAKGRWYLWGIGGYLAAYPLVLLVSLVNQQIWAGQGGSNPLLTLALENQDNVALIFFFVTAAIAAPIFEEIFFRGFLMTSLTRFMPGWGAVLASAFIFAAAHLSLAEILPLMTLGTVLGFVYGRSRNLLASILLHSLWNSGTLLSLFLLGSALRA
ncbi:MAG: CPBP family intramembrane metalloprotease [Synechococcales cyanobacterium RU_4_20]|nr:CPBP family intramembrane metalloprotease [Synechococcales cyanobacterium RU_4_20]